MQIVFLSSVSVVYPTLIGRVLPVARGLIQAGHQVQLLALHHDWAGQSQKEIVYQGVPVRYVGPMHVRGWGDTRRQLAGAELIWVALTALVRLTRAALDYPADLYHVWKPHPFNGIAGLVAARLRRRPLYIDCDDYETASSRFTGSKQQRIVRWFEDTLPRLATGVTVNTHFWEERLLHTLDVPAERVFYIANGVDMAWFDQVDRSAGQRLRRRFGLEGKAIVVYIGFLSLVGHPVDLLLEAFALVAQVLPQAHLVVVGGGEDGPALRRQVAEMGLAERVTFTGLVPSEEIAAYYMLGDCSVDPVRDDVHARARCPLKILESMTCGIPVVTGDVGDRRELLGDGRAGLLVRPGDAAALAEGIRTLLADPQKRAQMGSESRRQAQNYRWDRLSQDMLRFYQHVER